MREFVTGRFLSPARKKGGRGGGALPRAVYQPYLLSFSCPPASSCASRRRKTKSVKLRRNASNTKRGSKSLRFEGCCCCCCWFCRSCCRTLEGRDAARKEEGDHEAEWRGIKRDAVEQGRIAKELREAEARRKTSYERKG